MYSLEVASLLIGQKYRSSRGVCGEIVMAKKREDTKSDNAYLIYVSQDGFPYYWYSTIEVVA